MKKIIGIGNALTDILTRLDSDKMLDQIHLPKGSTQIISEDYLEKITKFLSDRETRFSTGGAAGNTIKALANLNHNTGFVGKVGDDLYGRHYRTTFSRLNIDTKLSVSECPSGVATTFITPDGECTFCTYLGAAALTEDDITPNLFNGYAYLYVEGYLVQNHEMIRKTIHTARENGLKIVLNMASYNIVSKEKDLFKELILHDVDILFANKEEAKSFTGKEGKKALHEMSAICHTVVLKQGAEGALIQDGEEEIKVEAYPVNIVDTTGAGDYFAAGFLYGYIQDKPLEICGKLGALLASEVIQTMGTTLRSARWETIKKEIKKIIK